MQNTKILDIPYHHSFAAPVLSIGSENVDDNDGSAYGKGQSQGERKGLKDQFPGGRKVIFLIQLPLQPSKPSLRKWFTTGNVELFVAILLIKINIRRGGGVYTSEDKSN
jgi:hypothetical protein